MMEGEETYEKVMPTIVKNMAEDKNPYEGLGCNYISYGDYCDPDTCWCRKKGEWDRKQEKNAENANR